ncbi:imidazolonepropionase-like domain-containing protein [Streptomyces sp. NPDC018045]|uniref:imidazolonepropionase-like domain-containing protein n=1 Tax=Streptomyces sp. NPDC018045 TaxID=3365037 RepID=UPI00378DA6F6
MLTIHRVHGVRRAPDGAPEPGHAVVVSGDRVEATGPYEELAERYGDRARVRDWDGTLTPGRHEPDGTALLEAAYHPDPREAGDLGTAPLTGDALAALGMTDTRWGASARRGIQRLLAIGTTSLSGPFTRPAVRTAVARSGLREPSGPRALAPGAPADFAVFAEDGRCLVTVLGGRLVYRGR